MAMRCTGDGDDDGYDDSEVMVTLMTNYMCDVCMIGLLYAKIMS